MESHTYPHTGVDSDVPLPHGHCCQSVGDAGSFNFFGEMLFYLFLPLMGKPRVCVMGDDDEVSNISQAPRVSAWFCF
jgi:hypothetical protein